LPGAVETVVAASRLHKAAAVNLPAAIAVSAVVEVNLIGASIIFDAGLARGKVRKRRRYFVVRQAIQDLSLKDAWKKAQGDSQYRLVKVFPWIAGL